MCTDCVGNPAAEEFCLPEPDRPVAVRCDFHRPPVFQERRLKRHISHVGKALLKSLTKQHVIASLQNPFLSMAKGPGACCDFYSSSGSVANFRFLQPPFLSDASRYLCMHIKCYVDSHILGAILVHE